MSLLRFLNIQGIAGIAVSIALGLLLIFQKGMETVRRFQDWAGPAVWVMMLILAIYLCVKSGTFAFTSDIPMEVLREKPADAGIPGDPGSWTVLFGVSANWLA